MAHCGAGVSVIVSLVVGPQDSTRTAWRLIPDTDEAVSAIYMYICICIYIYIYMSIYRDLYIRAGAIPHSTRVHQRHAWMCQRTTTMD